MKNDFFANIAASGIQNKKEGLVEPTPPILEEKILDFQEVVQPFHPLKKMSTSKELYEEVEKQKEYYRPFLQDLVPKHGTNRNRYVLKEFSWRIGTSEDAANLLGVMQGKGQWEKIVLPHYGEPRGKAVTYYRTKFELQKEDLEKGSLWVSFKAVDYKAHVFMNQCYVGSHEGFFAPFEFDFTHCAKEGTNELFVMVENDYIHMGNISEHGGAMHTGDKFYAATGLGYDDPLDGWHHCPPGMGIWQDVFIEAREKIFIKDLFVRPLIEKEEAELWVEMYSCDVGEFPVKLCFSVYGQNFEATVFENKIYIPETALQVGMGDTLTEAKVKAEGRYQMGIPMLAEKGINYFKIPFQMKDCRRWDLETPWLYQCHVSILNQKEETIDCQIVTFGMRSFTMDETSNPKGKFYLNGRQIRLRGANTMGHEQQCVLHEDWEQLLNDLLLAKVCNMNFLRLTQRPVQPEIYQLCDRLGLMIQTDLPMFAALRRNQFVEGLRQVQEMEHLIRSHACCVIASYMNEPMPNAHNKPHRNLTREEMEQFFVAADISLKLLNPDRVIKPIDGDYEPPSKGFPDNHCYTCWYNGHGLDVGKLHKGYWLPVKEGWHYGCGEFGIEALEDVSVMKKYYPKEWLEKEEEWNPAVIKGAQTGGFHYFFYDTQKKMEDWVKTSQTYQAEAIALMTKAFRRDGRMNSFAYHLFIDAFPAGWMKTIMDVDRNPKEGFFAYRDALTPLMTDLRCDRFTGFEEEEIQVEAWICNDKEEIPEGTKIVYQVVQSDSILAVGEMPAQILSCDSKFQGYVPVKLPKTTQRTTVKVQLALVDKQENVLHDSEWKLTVFPKVETNPISLCIFGEENDKINRTMKDMEWQKIGFDEIKENDWIVVTSYEKYREQEEAILEKVSQGAKLFVQELEAGSYQIGEDQVQIQNCGMLPLHFASRNTGHPLVQNLEKNDIRYWYDSSVDYMTPLLEKTIEINDFNVVVATGNQDQEGSWKKMAALVERSYGKGKIYINELKLFGRTDKNPVAAQLLNEMSK